MLDQEAGIDIPDQILVTILNKSMRSCWCFAKMDRLTCFCKDAAGLQREAALYLWGNRLSGRQIGCMSGADQHVLPAYSLAACNTTQHDLEGMFQVQIIPPHKIDGSMRHKISKR